MDGRQEVWSCWKGKHTLCGSPGSCLEVPLSPAYGVVVVVGSVQIMLEFSML